MTDPETLADLLETAIAALRTELIDSLPEDRRYSAAMVANAMAIAARSLRTPEPYDQGEDRDLAAAIRAGQHDADTTLLTRLRARTAARLTVSDPRRAAR